MLGDVPKWLKGPDSKSGRRRKACGGSNPSISAKLDKSCVYPMLYTASALLTGQTHKFDLQTVQNNGTGENEIIYIPMFYLLNGVTHGNFCF